MIAAILPVWGIAGTTAATAAASPTALSGVNVLGWGFGRPEAVATGGGHVWVMNESSSSIFELDASTGRLARVISGAKYGLGGSSLTLGDGIGGIAYGIAVAEAHVWVANSAGDSVTELDASTGSLVKVISRPRDEFNAPWAIASDRTHVWVANAGSNSVTELSASNGHLLKVLSSPIYGFDEPAGIAVEGGRVWLANECGNPSPTDGCPGPVGSVT